MSDATVRRPGPPVERVAVSLSRGCHTFGLDFRHVVPIPPGIHASP